MSPAHPLHLVLPSLLSPSLCLLFILKGRGESFSLPGGDQGLLWIKDLLEGCCRAFQQHSSRGEQPVPARSPRSLRVPDPCRISVGSTKLLLLAWGELAPWAASLPKWSRAVRKRRACANPLKSTGQGAEMEARGWESPAGPLAWPWNQGRSSAISASPNPPPQSPGSCTSLPWQFKAS